MLLGITIVVVVSNFLLGFYSYRRDRESVTHKLLFILSIILSLWAITNYISVSVTGTKALFWIRIVMVMTAAMFPALFLLVKNFPHKQLEISKKYLYLIIGFTIFIQILSVTPLVFEGVKVEGDAVTPVPGPAIILYALHVFAFLILTIYTLIIKYKKFKGNEKRQLKFLIIGIVLTFVLATITNFVFVNLLQVTSFVALGPLFTLLLVGFISYAIVKYDFLDIKILTTQIMTFIIWAALFSRIFASETITEIVFESVIFLIVFAFGILLIRSVMKEVTQREKLEVLTRKLKEMDKQKDEFISMAAHELRAPMTAIKGYLSMIMEGDAGKVPDQIAIYLKDAIEGNDRLVRLVNNMLNVGRIEEGRMVFQTGVVELAEVVTTIFDEFKTQAADKGLEYKLEVAKGIKDKVEVDKDRIHEVVTNLLSNSIKYTDKGSVIVKLINVENLVRFEVVDTGRGISKEEQKKLFQKFGRAESSSGKTIGTGLGLYISKLLINKFNGKIGLDSEPGKGSTFWFELPLKA